MEKQCIQIGIVSDIKGLDHQKRIYLIKGKCPCLNSMSGGNRVPKIYCLSSKQAHAYINEDKSTPLVAAMGMGGGQKPMLSLDKKSWRELTVLECERLQSVPENYTAGQSKTQRYKMIGNGWTVDVIKHILQGCIVDDIHK